MGRLGALPAQGRLGALPAQMEYLGVNSGALRVAVRVISRMELFDFCFCFFVAQRAQMSCFDNGSAGGTAVYRVRRHGGGAAQLSPRQ